MTVFAVILAGGAGSRLGGVQKARLRLGGQTLAQRVAARLRDAQAPLILSSGMGPAVLDVPAIVVEDLDLPLGGPLAGIVAAARFLSDRAADDSILVSVAVDTPLLPDDYIPRLTRAIAKGAPAARAVWRDNYYPTNAAWRLADLAGLPEQIAASGEPRSPRNLLGALGAWDIDWADTHKLDPFANLNSLADLAALAKRVDMSAP